MVRILSPAPNKTKPYGFHTVRLFYCLKENRCGQSILQACVTSLDVNLIHLSDVTITVYYETKTFLILILVVLRYLKYCRQMLYCKTKLFYPLITLRSEDLITYRSLVQHFDFTGVLIKWGHSRLCNYFMSVSVGSKGKSKSGSY